MSPEKAFKGSKHLLTRYLEDFGCVGYILHLFREESHFGLIFFKVKELPCCDSTAHVWHQPSSTNPIGKLANCLRSFFPIIFPTDGQAKCGLPGFAVCICESENWVVVSNI